MLDRRRFLQSAIALLPSSRFFAQQTTPIPLPLDDLAFTQMPEDFTGLSYETPQLYNPNFFAPTNKPLVDAYRALSTHGILRLGGHLSDVARWQSEAGDFATDKQTAAIEQGKTYWEWKLTDTTVRDHKDGAITPAAIHNLRGFLDATGWRLIYGLNFGSGSLQRAADEAACVAREIGPRLLTFQLGNESDFFGGNRLFREKGFDFDAFLAGYRDFVTAVRARTPHAPFAGPDTATNLDWVQQFATRAEKPIVLLSSHFYAMGPAKDPAMNAERLLAHNPRLDDQIAHIAKAKQAIAASGPVPFRVAEGNSCFGGGKPDVSDAFASALWGADYMLYTAAAGYAGVNLHGGGDGFYTPIETLAVNTATPRPLFFGMQFAERFADHEIARVPLPDNLSVTAYVGRSGKSTQLALINKGPTELAIKLAPGLPPAIKAQEWRLTAPSLEAKQGISFRRIPNPPQQRYRLPPYTAALLVWD